jgi:hypothetical protein
MPTVTAGRKTDAPKALPVLNGDFYQLAELSNAEELALCAIAVYAAMRNQDRQGTHFSSASNYPIA